MVGYSAQPINHRKKIGSPFVFALVLVFVFPYLALDSPVSSQKFGADVRSQCEVLTTGTMTMTRTKGGMP